MTYLIKSLKITCPDVKYTANNIFFYKIQNYTSNECPIMFELLKNCWECVKHSVTSPSLVSPFVWDIQWSPLSLVSPFVWDIQWSPLLLSPHLYETFSDLPYLLSPHLCETFSDLPFSCLPICMRHSVISLICHPIYVKHLVTSLISCLPICMRHSVTSLISCHPIYVRHSVISLICHPICIRHSVTSLISCHPICMRHSVTSLVSGLPSCCTTRWVWWSLRSTRQCSYRRTAVVAPATRGCRPYLHCLATLTGTGTLIAVCQLQMIDEYNLRIEGILPVAAIPTATQWLPS